ncbi:MAG: hypothetical protein GY715_19415 [Planctomycetes bacterium]|nr:hypothetical protein [Planctomycetota bacterium]
MCTPVRLVVRTLLAFVLLIPVVAVRAAEPAPRDDAADVVREDGDGRTALHRAALGGRESIVEALLRGGADPNATDARGETPLHLAARRARREVAALLIAAGAGVDARSRDGRTPLHLVADQGPAEDELDTRLVAIATLLLDAKADASARDADGHRPVDHAARRGHRRLAQLLEKHSGPPVVAPPPPEEGPLDDAYHTYAEIGSALLQAELFYPNICRRWSLGQSVQGRELWALNISDNVGVEEDEPEFKYISSMHGDEIMGMEMCLRLVTELTTKYGIDGRITNLVNGVDIWIVPCMNPDGLVSVSRNNAHGVNLNRNFPDPYTSPANTIVGREPETARIMEWSFARSFTLAGNFHSGAMVINYPFDANEAGTSVFTPTPDEDMFVWISEEYSRHNVPMWNSSSFYHGITNGADWYMIHGGMQDWSYVYMGCNEVTIELHNGGIPSASQIPAYWEDNHASMLAYMETVLIGVRGLVTDTLTGAPLDAVVTVIGRDHEVFTDPEVGDYHRMLLPGTYDLRFESDGYESLDVNDVVVATGPATRLDVALAQPCAADVDGDGSVGFGDILAVIGAWGACTGCPADLDGNGAVGFSDVLVIIGGWGPCA